MDRLVEVVGACSAILLLVAPSRGGVIEFIYSGSMDHVFRELGVPFESVEPGAPWTARLLFDAAVDNQIPSEYDEPSLAIYEGLSVDLAIGSSLAHFTPVTIRVANNYDVDRRGGVYIDAVDVFAGPNAEVHITILDHELDAIHSTAPPTSIDGADWAQRGIAFSFGGYATGSIDRVTSSIMPEPSALVLLGTGCLALTLTTVCCRRQTLSRCSYPPEIGRQSQ